MFNIAVNTFRELIRNRILSLILFFAFVMILFSQVLASLSLGQTDRIVLDFGLAMIEICGLISVVFVGGQILFKELEGRTIYLILSKPIARKDFILGKFLGFSAIIFVLIALQSAVFAGVLVFEQVAFDPLVITAVVAIFAKLLLVFAIILLCSTFTSPLLSILITMGIYIAAHSASTILDMAARMRDPALIYIGKALTAIMPNFEALNFAKNTIGTPIAISASTYATNFGLAALYLVVALVLTAVIFERKGFENA
jgi:Cu-processing system permease protein